MVVAEVVVAVVELVGKGSVTVVVGSGIVGKGTVGSGIDGSVIVVVGSDIAAAGDGMSPKVSPKPLTTAAKVKRPATRRASRGVRVRYHRRNIGNAG